MRFFNENFINFLKKVFGEVFFNVLTFRDVSPSHIQQQELFHEGSGILALVTPVGSSQMLLREPFEYGKNKKISIVYSLVIVLSL